MGAGSTQGKKIWFLAWWVETNKTMPFHIHAAKSRIYVVSFFSQTVNSPRCKFTFFKSELPGTIPTRTAKWDMSPPPPPPDSRV